MTFSSRLHRYGNLKLWRYWSPFRQNLRRYRTQHSTRSYSLPCKYFILLAAALLASVHAPGVSADTLRCGTKLVHEDDLAIQVREKCGDPISEELLGYRLGAAPPGLYGERELKIEQWIYGPDQGYYRVLIFEGGRVRNIDNVRQ